MCTNVIRPPHRTFCLNASKRAVGDYCVETGWLYRHYLADEEWSRLVRPSKSVVGMNDTRFTILQLLGILTGAWLLVVSKHRLPVIMGDFEESRSDNEVSIAHDFKGPEGGRKSRSRASMRLWSVLEVSSGWNFQASHVPGVLNSSADGISM